jgi:hypothetical protein
MENGSIGVFYEAMNPALLSEKVLILVSSAAYRPMKPRMMLKALKLADEEYRELRRAIKQLVREGRVLYGANHLVLPTVRNGSVRPKNPRPQTTPTESIEIHINFCIACSDKLFKSECRTSDVIEDPTCVLHYFISIAAHLCASACSSPRNDLSSASHLLSIAGDLLAFG